MSTTAEPFAASKGLTSRSRVSLRLPFAKGVALAIMHVYIVCLFFASTNILDAVGLDYGSPTGPQWMKIHVSTYVIIIAFIFFIVTYPEKRALFTFLIASRLGTVYFFLGTTLAAINILLGKRSGYGMYIDTHLNVFCSIMVLPFLSPPIMDRLERFIHWFFVINGVTALIEFGMGGNFFPVLVYTSEGAGTDSRITAFLSHPLHAATLTAVYVVSLLVGGGAHLAPKFRAPMIALQMAAMLAFAGRTALILCTLLISLRIIWEVGGFIAGRKKSRTTLIFVFTAMPILVTVSAALIQLGVFDSFADRFVEDSGSARARILMFDLIRSFSLSELLWGAQPEYVSSQVSLHGLEWGVENPLIRMTVFQGAIMAFFIMSGFLLLLREAYIRLRPWALAPMAAFLFLTSTFESYGGRFFAYSTFLVIVSNMFRRDDVTHVT